MTTKKEQVKEYKFKTYDEKGNINPNIYARKIFYSSVLNSLFIFIFYVCLTSVKASEVNFSMFNSYESFITSLIAMKNTLLFGFSWYLVIFILVSTLSILLISYLFYKSYKTTKFKASVQTILSSLGMTQYTFKSFDKKKRELTLTLSKGEKMDISTLKNKSDDICQLFEVGDFESSRVNKQDVMIRFRELLPDKKTCPQDVDFKKNMVFNKLFMGIGDLLCKAIYATLKEEGKGQFNGHWLIVGGSGSGKSFFIKELLKNILILVNYLMYDKIYIINYKKSADYNFMKKLKKVRYAQEIPDSLRLLKLIQLDMFSKYRYNEIHDQDNFIQYQTLVIIDEIQTLPETLEGKALSKIMKNTISECLSILEQLGSKARASNTTLINILQKADVHSLPSTAYRSNLRNRVMLKQENISSAHLVVNSDVTEKNNINPLDLMQGQLIYWDMLTAEVRRIFAVFNNFEIDYEALNNQKFDEETQKAVDTVNSYKKIAIEAIKVEQEIEEQLEKDGKKTHCDSFEEAMEYEEEIESTYNEDEIQEIEKKEKRKTKDAFAIAEERIKAKELQCESTLNLNKKEKVEIEPKKKILKKINIKKPPRKTVSEKEILDFREEQENIKDELEEQNLNLDEELNKEEKDEEIEDFISEKQKELEVNNIKNKPIEEEIEF
jgi:hypothetical protein